jgi:hypothetical protein
MGKAGNPTSSAPRRPLLTLACLCALIAASPWVSAAARLSASLGFGGIIVPGRWNPLWIRCESCPADTTIHVVLKSPGGAEIGVETFPSVDGVRLECPVRIDDNLDSISVRLVSSGRILVEEKLAARARVFPGHLVLVCGENSKVEHAIASVLYPSEPVKALPLSITDLPSAGLSYDCVSAVVLDDRGPVLAPAQRDAMLSWISGGGRLVVTALRESGKSVADTLFPERARKRQDGRPASFKRGLGFVKLFDAQGSSRLQSEAEWKAALDLAPYDKSGRITAGRVFNTAPYSFEKDSDVSRAETIILVSLALWASVLAFVSRNRRKSFVPILGVCAFSLLFAFAGSMSLDSMLKRQSRTSLRLLVLPGDGSSFASVSVRDASAESWGEGLRIETVRGIAVEFRGIEDGRLPASESAIFTWNHRLPASVLSLHPREGGILELNGVLSPTVLTGSDLPLEALSSGTTATRDNILFGGRSALVVPSSRGLVWRVQKNGSWVDESAAPSWVGPDQTWVEELAVIVPGRSFLVGRNLLPQLQLKVGGASVREFFWAIPLVEGES